MLVYLKEPMGYTQIGLIRIYGRRFGSGRFGPADVPKNVYIDNKEILEDAEYTPHWLKKRFGKTFPPIIWRISDLSKLDYESLVEIANAMGIECIRRKNPTTQDRHAIKRSILSKL